jgi:FCD domain
VVCRRERLVPGDLRPLCGKPFACSRRKVSSRSRRGASVLRLTGQEARETIEVRALLEGHNARLAARHRDQETIRRIEKVLARGTRAVAAGRLDRLLELNQEFHSALYAAGRNTVLGDLVQKLRGRTAMLSRRPTRRGRRICGRTTRPSCVPSSTATSAPPPRSRPSTSCAPAPATCSGSMRAGRTRRHHSLRRAGKPARKSQDGRAATADGAPRSQPQAIVAGRLSAVIFC